MLCNSVPGHHGINNLRAPSSPLLVQFVPKPKLRSLSQTVFGTTLSAGLPWQGQTAPATPTPSSPTRIALGPPLPDSCSRGTRRQPPLRAAVYVCCSTAGKTWDRSIPETQRNPLIQQAPLLEFLRLRRWSLHRIYVDQLTGDRQARPGFGELMENTRHHRFDVIVVDCFERLAPNLKRLVFILDELSRLGVGLVSRREGLDTTNLVGRGRHGHRAGHGTP